MYGTLTEAQSIAIVISNESSPSQEYFYLWYVSIWDDIINDDF